MVPFRQAWLVQRVEATASGLVSGLRDLRRRNGASRLEEDTLVVPLGY